MRAAAAPPNGIDGRAAAAAAAAAGEAFDAAAAQATAAVARQAAESRAAAEAAGATAEQAEAAFGEAARARALAAAEARGAAVEAASAAAAEEVRLLVAEKRAAERDRDFYAARLESQLGGGGGGDGGGRDASTLQVGRGAARSTSSRGSTRRALQHDAQSLHPPLLRRNLEWPQSECSRAAAAWQVQLQDVQRRLDEAGQATDAARKQCADAVRERHLLKARAAATTPSQPTPPPP